MSTQEENRGAGLRPASGSAPNKAAKTLTGKVVSNKMQKTITVSVERYVPHPEYGKYLRRTTKFLAHDENSESREGDVVAIEQCRPMSRHKSWRVVRIVSRAEQAGDGLTSEGAGEATP